MVDTIPTGKIDNVGRSRRGDELAADRRTAPGCWTAAARLRQRTIIAPEPFLEPVLGELGASSPTRGLFLIDAEAANDWADSDLLSAWLRVAKTHVPARLLDTSGVAQL